MTEASLDLVSRRANQNIYIGRLVNESLLGFPPAMRIILLVSFFATVYLFIFLLFNLRQDNMTVIQSRLKKLQVNLLEEYYEQKGDFDWSRWKKELEQRREDVRSELKRGLLTRTGDPVEIDNFIDRSWDDLMAIMGGQMESRDRIDEDKLRALLKRLLTESLTPPPPKAIDEAPGPEFAPDPAAEEPEELEALDEADAPEAPEPEAEAPKELATPDKMESPKTPEPETEEPKELAAPDKMESPETPESKNEEPEELEALDKAKGPETPESETEEPKELATLEKAKGPETPEPETEEPEELEALDKAKGPETPESETEAPKEFETVDEAKEPETIAEFQEVDPLGFDMSGGPMGTAINNLVSALEFGPEPEEDEWEKDEAAGSLAEHFEIQSPFAEIFSTLSTVEFEPEPMESLESLENEGLEPDDSPGTEAEELERNFMGILFSTPFLTALNSEITVLEAEDEDTSAPAEDEGGETREPEEGETGPVVEERDGVAYINESVLNPDEKNLKGLNKNFKNLIDSILHNTGDELNVSKSGD
jgi:hypothetical protein